MVSERLPCIFTWNCISVYSAFIMLQILSGILNLFSVAKSDSCVTLSKAFSQSRSKTQFSVCLHLASERILLAQCIAFPVLLPFLNPNCVTFICSRVFLFDKSLTVKRKKAFIYKSSVVIFLKEEECIKSKLIKIAGKSTNIKP